MIDNGSGDDEGGRGNDSDRGGSERVVNWLAAADSVEWTDRMTE